MPLCILTITTQKFLVSNQWKETSQNNPRYQFFNTIFENLSGWASAQTTLKTLHTFEAREVTTPILPPLPILQPRRCPWLEGVAKGGGGRVWWPYPGPSALKIWHERPKYIFKVRMSLFSEFPKPITKSPKKMLDQVPMFIYIPLTPMRSMISNLAVKCHISDFLVDFGIHEDLFHWS